MCRQVARYATQPSAIDDLGGLLGHLVVPSHDHEAAIAEFAALTYRYDLASRRIDEFDLDMGQRLCRRSPAFNSNGSFASVMVMQQLPSVCPKTDEDIRPQPRFHLLHQEKRNGSAT